VPLWFKLQLLPSRAMDEIEVVLAVGDAELVRRVDVSVAAASERAGDHVTCRLGCMHCCIGSFPITALDARRLRVGLQELRRHRPWDADAVLSRARSQWAEMHDDFPGDPGIGSLGEDDEARAGFAEQNAEAPCPALEPSSSSCLLYEARPVTCRLFGLPVRHGGELADPCELNFTAADEAAVASATVDADADDLEARLLALLGNPPETVVAAVFAGEEAERKTQDVRRKTQKGAETSSAPTDIESDF